MFDAFWLIATRKTSKGSARKALRKALSKTDAHTLLAAWRSHNEVWSRWPEDEHRFIPHPATWLNGERWEDDPPQEKASMQSFVHTVAAATAHLTPEQEKEALARSLGMTTETASLRAITGATEGEVR